MTGIGTADVMLNVGKVTQKYGNK